MKYIMGDNILCYFNRKMDFYLTASPSLFPCIEITWIAKSEYL